MKACVAVAADLQSQTLPNWPRPSSLILVRSLDSICCKLLGISMAASWTSCHLPDPVHSPVAIPLPTINLYQTVSSLVAVAFCLLLYLWFCLRSCHAPLTRSTPSIAVLTAFGIKATIGNSFAPSRQHQSQRDYWDMTQVKG